MKNISVFVLFAILLSGCEVFVIKAPYRHSNMEVIDLSQRTPLGAVYLFKAELDSNNIFGALAILAAPSGQQYLAIERYEKKDEVSRIRRMIASRKITDITTDTLSTDTFNIKMEFDWTRKIQFTASKISDSWYITDYRY